MMTIFGIRDYLKDVLEIRQQPHDEEVYQESGRERFVHNFPNNLQQRQEREKRARPSGKTLQVNLVLCNITVWIMFVVGVIECAFAAMMQDDIKDDNEYHSQCTNYYVHQPLPDLGSGWEDVSGKCHMLLIWTYIMIVGASFSLFRTLMQALPVNGPNHLTIQYQRGGTTDRLLTPAHAYGIRTFFSFISCILHIVSAIMLGLSPVIRDKTPAAEEYHIGYILGLSAICISVIMTGHQTFTTGLASWQLRS